MICYNDKTPCTRFWYSIESNYDEVRYNYEEYLYDMWYSRQVISETKDWRDVYCQSEYDIYLENLS